MTNQIVTETTLLFEERLKKNPGFDFLNNLNMDKQSIKNFQLVISKYYPPFFNSYHLLPFARKKREELSNILSKQKDDDLM